MFTNEISSSKEQLITIRAYYLRPKDNGDYFVYPKHYNFVTTKAFIKSLKHNHFVALTTHLPNEAPTTVHAHIGHFHKFDPEHDANLKELHAETIRVSKKEITAWYNYVNILKKQHDLRKAQEQIEQNTEKETFTKKD